MYECIYIIIIFWVYQILVLLGVCKTSSDEEGTMTYAQGECSQHYILLSFNFELCKYVHNSEFLSCTTLVHTFIYIAEEWYSRINLHSYAWVIFLHIMKSLFEEQVGPLAILLLCACNTNWSSYNTMTIHQQTYTPGIPWHMMIGADPPPPHPPPR